MSEADEFGNHQAVIPLSIVRLRKVVSMVKDPNELLFRLLSPKDGFIERLKQGSKDNEMTSLLLKVTALALSSVHRSSRIEFLGQVSGTKFLQQDLSNFLKSCAAGNDKVSGDTLKDIMRILEALNQSFPSRSIGTVTTLSSLVKYIVVETDKSMSGELAEEFKRLEDGLVEIRKQVRSGTVLPDQEKVHDVIVPEFCNFKRLAIEPTDREISGDELIPYLRENRIYLEYKDVGDYLDVQFRLLKEDLIRPLRDGLAEFKENQQNGARGAKSYMKAYTDVEIQPSHCSREGLVYEISFDFSRLRDVNWEESKRLLPGSLVCLSSDDFSSMLVGTIADRKPEDLHKGITYIYLDQSNNYMELLRFRHRYVMIESPAYYEPYKHVLSVLQQVDENNFPFKSYFLNQKLDAIPPPKYLQENQSEEYNFSSLMRSGVNNSVPASSGTDEVLHRPCGTAVPVLKLEDWPSSDDLGLDESQYGALRTALTKEFVVIQGPPGTGKTFLGLKIIQLLLENNKRNRLWTGPILLVSYTNHALDQFLEEVVRLYPMEAISGKLVRIGHKSSSVKSGLMPFCSLDGIRKEHRFPYGRNIYILKRRMKKLEIKIMEIMACIQKSETSILSYEALFEFMNEVHFNQLNATDIYLRWLSGEDNELDPSRTFGTWRYGYTYLRMSMFECDIEDDYDSSDEEYSDTSIPIKIPEYSYSDIVKKMTADSYGIFLGNKRISDDLRAILRRAEVNSLETRMRDYESVNINDVWQLNLVDRWRLYSHWVSCFVEQAWRKIRELLGRFSARKKQLEELNNFRDCAILREAKVVAMTTTSAAKRNEVLRAVGPRVVIVEEAAEVLEAHVVASLSASCEHLILIGDHQQLRPKPADYALSKQYRMDVSLFEKVVLNNLHCERLEVQHRMRPEIAELLVPHIYRSLRNHGSVLRYENIAGIFGNIFFVNHTELENDENDDRSHSNLHEARFVVAFCGYLINVGYSESEITLLTTYSGQLRLMRGLMPHKGVRITTVDNYQGEENTIILLSLVRSNRKSSIGFLKTANRVCVLLSRARQGLYIIGNGELLTDQSVLWGNILGTLKANDRYVEGLPLGCKRHPDRKFIVKTAEDFRNVPSHGCFIACEYRLDCGHVCDKKCHELDEKHLRYICRKPCERKPIECPDDHPCLKKCYEICGDCTFRVRRTLDKCGHDAEMMCHVKVEDFKCMEPCRKSCTRGHPCKRRCYEDCLCNESVERILSKCHHRIEMPCHQEPNEHYKCKEMVEKLLPKCSHIALMPCHMPESDYRCREPCTKTCPSGHLCRKRCSQTCSCDELVEAPQHEWCKHEAMVPCSKQDSYSCQEQCERILCSAGHRCSKRCYQPCGACKVVVRKELLRCQHTADFACEESVVGHKCREKCQRSCPSGHPCQLLCFEPCRCSVEIAKSCPKCNEATPVECWQSAFECQRPCKETLSCGHSCQNHCGSSQCTTDCKVIVEKVLSCTHSIGVECSTANKGTFTELICRQLTELENVNCEYGHLKVVECQNARDPVADCIRPTYLPCTNNNPQHQTLVPCHLWKLPDICQLACSVQLLCGHYCRRKCRDCAASGTHDPCRERCDKPKSFCRHRCQLPCGTSHRISCGRCEASEQQITSCQHKPYLNKTCSAPRASCQEPCTWKCRHHGCTAVCSEPCDRLQCNEPCKNLLKCRHTCAGVCGEPCPEQCRLCHRKDLVSTCQQFNVPFEDETAFLVLRGCGHVVPVSGMDAWVTQTAQRPPYRVDGDLCLTCPVCGERLGSCPRYNRILKAYEMHLNVAKARSSATLGGRVLVLGSAKRWFRENYITWDSLGNEDPLKTLKTVSACILNDIMTAAKSLHTSSDDYSLRLSLIIDELKGLRNSWDFNESIIVNDMLKLYAVYLEVKTRQIIMKFPRGPRLGILDRCTELLNSCKVLEEDNVMNFRERWTIIEQVNHLLCTKLELRERKDNISDYIQTLNRYFDNAHDLDHALYWLCCSKGHVFPSEDSIDRQNIDERCLPCLFQAKFGMSKFFSERKNTLPLTSHRYPVFIEKIPSAFMKWTGNDVTVNHLPDPPLPPPPPPLPTASPKPEDAEVFEKLIFPPTDVAVDADSAEPLPVDYGPDVVQREPPRRKSADSAERKYELPESNRNNNICDSTGSQEKPPSNRRPYEGSFSLRMEMANRTEEETPIGPQDLDLDPGRNSFRRSESSSVPSSVRKERPEILGNWRDRSEYSNSTRTTSFDGMRCTREGKPWQKSRRPSDNQEEALNWREGRETQQQQQQQQDNWRKRRNQEQEQP